MSKPDPRAAKIKQLKRLQEELERIMPETHGWRHQYSCMICGSVVTDRGLHLRWHKGADTLDVLVTLFGRTPRSEIGEAP